MIFKQYFLGCLSHASYLVGDTSSGRAVVVDPQRDVSAYLHDAAEHGLRIERVIETHFHADFVSGHLELAHLTGAVISYGESATADFPIETLRDGDRIDLGEVRLEIMSTPGHTPESISVVVYEHADDATPYAVLTGDTLFIGDVGRPDLLASGGMSADVLARQLYNSLHTKLLALPDVTRVYPAHGAGSSCGRSLSTQSSSTIGEQRRENYALAPMSEEAFVAVVTEDQPVAPAYFSFDAGRNREQRELLDERVTPDPLDLPTVKALQQAGAVVLDTRSPTDFAAGHLSGSLNVGLDGRFAEYAGNVLRPAQRVVLVCDQGREVEAKVRLGRIGFDRVVGYLADALTVLAENPDPVVRSSRLTATELSERLGELDTTLIDVRNVDRVVGYLADALTVLAENPDLVVRSSRLTATELSERLGELDTTLIDVRNAAELDGGKIDGAVHIPLAQLRDRLDEIDRDRPVVAYCASGFRSSIAASVIAAAGHSDVSDLLGGYEAWHTLQH